MQREDRPPAEHDSDHFSEEEVIAERRRALEQQLPTAGFPAGSGKPSVVYLWASMFLAAVTVLVFGVNNQRGVPPAVLESQRDNVSKLASSIRLNMEHSVKGLERLVAGQLAAPKPDPEFLKQVIGDGATWSGAAIVEIASRRPLATLGSGVPFEQLPPALPVNATFPIATADGLSLIRSTALDASRALLTMQPLTVGNMRLNPAARHGVFVLTPDGRSTLMQGVSAVDDVHLPTVFRGLTQPESSKSRAIIVAEWPDQQLVAAAAPVEGTGVTVASLLVADVTGGTSTTQGLLLGLTLLAMAVPSFLLMRMAVVRPVNALLRCAKADACGADPVKQKPQLIAEAHRIARALALTSRDTPPTEPRERWRPTVRQVLTTATVVALLWPAAAVATSLGASAPPLPDQLVRDEESRAEAASNALGRGLDNGLQTVVRVSDAVDPANPSRSAPVLQRELAEERRFRNLYLATKSGSVISSAGREPLRKEQPPAGDIGIQLDDSNSRLPVVYAFRVRPDGFAVIGEFDLDYLMGVMRQVGMMDEVDGRVRVVDENMRTVLDSQGFRAFEVLRGPPREAATEALSSGTVSRARTPQGSPALLAAASLTRPNTVAHLKWSTVVEQDLAALKLPESLGRRWTLLIAGAAVGLVLFTQVWNFYIFSGPFRRLADAADKIGNCSFDDPIPPERHDDIGALAMCLEICRQVRCMGPARYGGVIRLRGTEANRTTVPPDTAHATVDRAGPPLSDQGEKRDV
jgi:hypothetical protein